MEAAPAITAVAEMTAEAAEEILTLDDHIAIMTAHILDTQAATQLHADTLAGLSPEILAIAEELGLFGLSIMEVVAMTAAAVPEISDLDALLAQMTMTITDTAAATELQEMLP